MGEFQVVVIMKGCREMDEKGILRQILMEMCLRQRLNKFYRTKLNIGNIIYFFQLKSCKLRNILISQGGKGWLNNF